MRAVCQAVNVRQLTQRTRILINLNPITPGRVESLPNFAAFSSYKQPLASYRRTFTTTTMSSLESITQSLSGLSIKPSVSVSHSETTSPATWREALNATSTAPKSFELIKTLVFKPKTAKTAIVVPVVVIARDETETNSGALGKKLNLKELRLASEDLLKEFFSLDKNSRTCLYRLKYTSSPFD
jgi:prolyl-tRNA synthetase